MLILAVATVLGGAFHFRAVHHLPRWPSVMDAAEFPDLPILVDQGFHFYPAARGWFPPTLADRKQFFYPGSKFLFYESAAEGILFPDWQMDAAREMHASINLVRRLKPTDIIYRIEIPNR